MRCVPIRALNKLAVPFLSDEGTGEDDYALLPPPRPLGVLQLMGITFFAVSGSAYGVEGACSHMPDAVGSRLSTNRDPRARCVQRRCPPPGRSWHSRALWARRCAGRHRSPWSLPSSRWRCLTAAATLSGSTPPSGQWRRSSTAWPICCVTCSIAPYTRSSSLST